MKITASDKALRIVQSGKDDVTLQPGESAEFDSGVVEARVLGLGPEVDLTFGGALGSAVNPDSNPADSAPV